jgi:hypothetical protein
MYIRISNKRKVILCRTKWSGTSYDIDNARFNTPVAPGVLLMLDRVDDFAPSTYSSLRWEVRNLSRCCGCKGRPHRGRWHYLLRLSYFLWFFILLVSFDSLYCPYLHLFLPLDLSSLLCLFNCVFSSSTTYKTTTAIYRRPVLSSIINTHFVKLSSIPACLGFWSTFQSRSRGNAGVIFLECELLVHLLHASDPNEECGSSNISIAYN